MILNRNFYLRKKLLQRISNCNYDEFKKELQEIGPWDKTINLLMKHILLSFKPMTIWLKQINSRPLHL